MLVPSPFARKGALTNLTTNYRIFVQYSKLNFFNGIVSL